MLCMNIRASHRQLAVQTILPTILNSSLPFKFHSNHVSQNAQMVSFFRLK